MNEITPHNTDFDRLVEEEALIESTMELVSEILEEDGISRTELAKRLGKSKGFVSQILSGDRNMTLRTLAQVMFALDSRAKFGAEPLSNKRTYRVGSGRHNSAEDEFSPHRWIMVRHFPDELNDEIDASYLGMMMGSTKATSAFDRRESPASSLAPSRANSYKKVFAGVA